MEHIFDRPIPLTEVVTMATGLDFETLPQATAKKLNHNLDKLQVHLTEIGSTICRQYFRLTWIPLLGTSLAWLVMVMRSRCYYNPETEELRDTYTWQKKELAESLGQSTKNLSNLLSHPCANLFCQILEQNKRKFTVRVSMVYEPMAPENSSPGYSIDLDPFDCEQDKQDVPQDKNGQDGQTLPQENQKNVPVTTSQNRKNIPVTTAQNQKIFPVTTSESEICSDHTPLNQKNVPSCKYSEESVPMAIHLSRDTMTDFKSF